MPPQAPEQIFWMSLLIAPMPSRSLKNAMMQMRAAVTRESAPLAARPAATGGYDILITRPERAAQHLCGLLQKSGYRPLIEPMLTITAEHGPPPPLQDAAAVIFSSPNAVALTPYGDLPSGWSFWPCYCVGTRTAHVAEKYGWQNIIAGDGGGTHLAQLIQARHKPKSGSLLHIGGAHIMAEPDAGLRAAGCAVMNWTVYRAHAVRELSPACRNALAGSLRAVLFFSARTVRTFAGLVQQAGQASCCERLIALCLSTPVASAAAMLPWRTITVAAAPHEGAMIEALQTTDN